MVERVELLCQEEKRDRVENKARLAITPDLSSNKNAMRMDREQSSLGGFFG